MSGLLRDNLQPTDFADSICKVTDWYDFDGYLACGYRVWVCRCTNHWFQRHEWIIKGKNQTEVDDWIYLGMYTKKEFEKSFIHDGHKIIQETSV